MMRMRTKLTGLSPMNGNTASGERHRDRGSVGANNGGVGVGGGGGAGGGEGGPENWEMRPCGMLVQKRVDGDQDPPKPVPTIRVRVKYASIYHEIHINSQASFGELKKMLAGVTGLHHQDMKVYYKDKERDSKEFLDIVGVKDKSKMVLVEDPISQEKRYLEMRKNAKMEKAAKSISAISLEVDKLGSQVGAMESVILKGGRVTEKEIGNLIELLMNELIKLDGIYADGDVKLQRKMQVTRVQKYVETLDVLKVKNATPAANGVANEKQQKFSNGNAKNSVTGNGHSQEKPSRMGKPPLPSQRTRHSIGHSPLQPQAQQQQQPSRHSTSGTSGTVVTTQWETFESAPPLIPVSPTSSSESAPRKTINPKFPWDFE